MTRYYEVVFGNLQILSRTFPNAKQVIPRTMRLALGNYLLNKAVTEYPDRIFMRKVIIPYIIGRRAQRVLNVGVRSYTVEITDQLMDGGVEVWTLDIDPEAHVWGSPGRHIIGDAMRLDEIDGLQDFSCVLFNGVLGYGVNTPDEIGRALKALSAIMPNNGILVLGWNTDRVPDPVHHPEFGRFRYLQDSNLRSRVTFQGSTHVYDFLEIAGAAYGPADGVSA